KVRIPSVAIQTRDEGMEAVPTRFFIMLVEPRRRTVQHYEVQLAVACQIHELSLRLPNGCVWLCGNQLGRCERRLRALYIVLFDPIDWTEITLVEPALGLLRQNSRKPFPVQVYPLIDPAI